MADEPVFLYLAAYDSEDDARLDYDGCWSCTPPASSAHTTLRS